jgi:hypothetical protein
MSTTASQPVLSPAVLNCWTAYEQIYAIERGEGASDDRAHEEGKMAYRQAMPCLADQASIRDFIACVTHGMVLRLIANEDGTKLIYAANVAAGFFHREAKEAKEAKMAKEAKDSKMANQASESQEAAEAKSDPSATREAA